MEWDVLYDENFAEEFVDLENEVRTEILALTVLLKQFGPNLGRPHVDTLNGSEHSNMKELRFNAVGGVWRVAFAFDPKRQAIILTASDKTGTSQKRFYKRLIAIADERFNAHLAAIKNERKK